MEKLFKASNGCWLWTGSQFKDGYGQTHIKGQKSPIRAHRLAWLIYKGPIPEGLWVLHRCDVRLCCNPDHLFLGTALDNNRDTAAKGRCNPRRRGTGHPSEKLNVALVAALKRLYWDFPISQGKLAKRFGVSQSVISRIVTNKTRRGLKA